MVVLLAIATEVSLADGDIVILEGGEIVTADLRLIEAPNLAADESALTGESVLVAKAPDAVPRTACAFLRWLRNWRTRPKMLLGGVDEFDQEEGGGKRTKGEGEMTGYADRGN